MRLISPIYHKELLQLAASRRHAGAKLLFLLALFGVTWLTLYDLPGRDGAELVALGQRYFAVLYYTVLVAVLLFAPLVTGGCVAGEREANTLPLLLHTRLTAWQIVQDKGLSRLTHLLYLASLTVPFLALGLLLGGIEGVHVIVAAAYVLSAVLVAGGLALLLSAVRHTAVQAVASTYVYLLLFHLVTAIGTFVMYQVSAFGGGGLGNLVRLGWLAAGLSPFGGMALLLAGRGSGTPGTAVAVGLHLAVAVLVYFVCVAGATRRLRRELGVAPTLASAAGPGAVAPGRWRGAWARLNRPLKLRPVRMLACGPATSWRPDIFAARLGRWLRQNRVATVLVLLAALIPGLIGGPGAYRSYLFYGMLYAGLTPVLLLAAAVKAASCFTQEREQQRFELLAATAYRGHDVVRGVYVALWRSLLPLLLGLAAVLLLGLAVVRDGAYFRSRLTGWPLLLVPLYLNGILLLGLRLSLWCRTSLRAIGALLVVLAFFSLGPYVLAVLLEAVDRGHHGLTEFLAAASPITILALAAEAQAWHHLWQEQPAAIVGNVALALAASAFLYTDLRWGYDAFVGRQPGG